MHAVDCAPHDAHCSLHQVYRFTLMPVNRPPVANETLAAELEASGVVHLKLCYAMPCCDVLCYAMPCYDVL